MKASKQSRIIAVDTSIGTNFLISACDDETFSKLRELIQTGHFSCFPGYGSINVLALMVEYSGRDYHVADSLHIGEVFKKSWNRVHADVSFDASRAPSVPNASKSAEAESLTNKKGHDSCAVFHQNLLPKSAVSTSLSEDVVADGHNTEVLVHSSVPVFCGEKTANCFNDMNPVVINGQTSAIVCKKKRCPLLSSDETPYTQPHSIATFSNSHLIKECKWRKRKHGTKESMGKKQKHDVLAGLINDTTEKDTDLGHPGKDHAFNVGWDIDPQGHESSFLRDQQCKYDALCEHELNEEIVHIQQVAQHTEDHEELQKRKPQLENTSNSKTFLTDERMLREHSMKEPSLSHVDTVGNGYSLTACLERSTNHKDLEDLDASLSADVVLETQESGLQCQDGCIAELKQVDVTKGDLADIEHISVKGYYGCVIQNSLESQALNVHELSCHEEVVNKTVGDVNKSSETLACPSKENEVSNLQHSISMNPQFLEKNTERNDIQLAHSQNVYCDNEQFKAGPTGSTCEFLTARKKKKHKRKRFYESPKVSSQEDSRCLVSSIQTQDIEGLAVWKEFAEQVASFLENSITLPNHEGPESSFMAEEQLQAHSTTVGANFLEIARQNPSVVPPSCKNKTSAEQIAILSQNSADTCNIEKFEKVTSMLEEMPQIYSYNVGAGSKEKSQKRTCEGSYRAASLSTNAGDTQECEMQVHNDEHESQEIIKPKRGMHNTSNEPESSSPDHVEHGDQPHKTGVAAGSHGTPRPSKRKKYRKRKASDTSRISVQEDVRSVFPESNNQAIEGTTDAAKDAVQISDVRFVFPESNNQAIEGTMDAAKDGVQISDVLQNPAETCNHQKGVVSDQTQEYQTQTELRNDNAGPQRQNEAVLNTDESRNKEFLLAREEAESHAKVLMELSINGKNGLKATPKDMCEIRPVDLPCAQDSTAAAPQVSYRKGKKQKKDNRLRHSEVVLGASSLNVTNEGYSAAFSIKELPMILALCASMDGDVCHRAEVASVQLSKENSEKEMMQAEPNTGFMPEEQDMAITITNDPRDGSIPSLPGSSRWNGCCEEVVLKSKPSLDAFDYESSETMHSLEENCIGLEVTDSPETINLQKISSAAVQMVEDYILESSKRNTRKSSRKSIHPKRWIEVLSERLNSRQTARNSSKKQQAYKRSKPTEEEAEAKGKGNQNINLTGAVVCPVGCGRLYTKKTSAYYRHCRLCEGE